MGIYIYTVRKSGAFKAEIKGETSSVYPVKFAARCAWNTFGGLDAFCTRKIEHARTIWNKFTVNGGTLPKFVCVCDDEGPLQSGDPVYEYDWSSKDGPAWFDCEKFPGELVGYLVKRGRKWSVRKHYTKFIDQGTYEGSKTLRNGSWEPTYHGVGWHVFGPVLRDGSMMFNTEEEALAFVDYNESYVDREERLSA